MPIRNILCFCAFAFPVSALGQDDAPPQLSHAVFADGERSLENVLEFPDSDGDIEVVVSCSAHATAKGRLKNVRCSSANDPGLKFSNSVTRRSRSARLRPAMVDGEAREVDFQFSVRFRKQRGEETIEPRLNNGNNTERLGDDYIGAQRYSRHAWPSVCNDLAFLQQGGQKVIVEVAIIDRDGGARDADVISEIWRVPGPCQTALKEQIATGRWIPASLDGHFVEAIWVSPITINRTDDMRAGTVAEF